MFEARARAHPDAIKINYSSVSRGKFEMTATAVYFRVGERETRERAGREWIYEGPV